MVFVWACGRKGSALAGFGWACVRKGAWAGEWDHLPTRSGFNQGPSLVVHLCLVGTRIWTGFWNHWWVGRELRISRPTLFFESMKHITFNVFSCLLFSASETPSESLCLWLLPVVSGGGASSSPHLSLFLFPSMYMYIYIYIYIYRYIKKFILFSNIVNPAPCLSYYWFPGNFMTKPAPDWVPVVF